MYTSTIRRLRSESYLNEITRPRCGRNEPGDFGVLIFVPSERYDSLQKNTEIQHDWVRESLQTYM